MRRKNRKPKRPIKEQPSFKENTMELKVNILSEAFEKLKLYIECAAGEISGLGTVENINNTLVVTDVFILPQESSSSNTELDDEAISDLLLSWDEQGLPLEKLKLWWHSHGNMGTFWSTTDDNTIEKLGSSWMLSIVGNKKNEFLARFDLYSPLKLTVDNLALSELKAPNTELKNTIKEEIKEKVRTTVWANSNYNANRRWDSKEQRWIYNWEEDDSLDENTKILAASNPKAPVGFIPRGQQQAALDFDKDKVVDVPGWGKLTQEDIEMLRSEGVVVDGY